MRKRLDLDSMLRKYQGNYSSSQLRNDSPYRNITSGLEIRKQNQYVIPQIQNKLKIQKNKTQTSYYPENNYNYYQTVVNNRMQMPVQSQRSQARDKVSSVTFQMSKSECQKLLRGIREEIKLQEKQIDGQIKKGTNDLRQKFQSQHEQLRKQLISMVDNCLQMNRKQIQQTLEAFSREYPTQFLASKKKIQMLDGQIQRLLNGLNGPDFKKVIAQIVTKDFTGIVQAVREDTKNTNKVYRQNLGEVQLNRNVITNVKDNLQKIYYWQKAGNTKNQNKYVEETERNMKISRNSSKKKIFEQQNNGYSKMFMTLNQQAREKSNPKTMRRSFFNFDKDYQ